MFCFWNIVVVDQNNKCHVVMGTMTMFPNNAAVYWILSSMVSLCPEAADIVKITMSDLGTSVLLHMWYFFQ